MKEKLNKILSDILEPTNLQFVKVHLVKLQLLKLELEKKIPLG